ncbi:hypothetical protein [Rugamonas aquatica]|uniref:Uncharacterized protein n=1 Tax=Rugamonas aquatica TaxID=2743357 RepID=A0A6A7N6E1_9BURK|nr:hypothetical protein [Rugamonas aquatica]MQA40663.1 hypothetical protein [Rugamonas aquatica]
MFEVTGEDIAKLNDSDLRELVGRLCIAELRQHQQSSHAATFGGDQDAADGGIDVRVTLPAGAQPLTAFAGSDIGFQVRKPTMGPADIIKEMRPDDKLRESIAALAKAGGTYVIVSSGDSTTDTMLANRRAAMRAALAGNRHRGKLNVDFYDSKRMATWVGDHPGEVLWVRERCGRSCPGWKGYTSWSYPVSPADGCYLVDPSARLRVGAGSGAVGIVAALQAMRAKLSQPGAALRLVGLSGVGKTSLVQALFDARVGSCSLPESWAVYTDFGSVTQPHPATMATELIALKTRAVLVVDNCLPDVHRELVRLCSADGSTLSVITVEYDVRDDQPERTDVVEMDGGSNFLIADLLEARYPILSAANRGLIADKAGGNARLALALAGTVREGDSLVGWSDADLFHRLFWQRHLPDSDLLAAARACALVYSFDGVAFDSDLAELPLLGSLVGLDALKMALCVNELVARDLVQVRSQWRALLPPALANRLAEEALQAIPSQHLEKVLLGSAPPRLLRSFCRRLSHLPTHRYTVDLAAKWLCSGGRLEDVATHDDEQRMMFKYLAPSAQALALAALERGGAGMLGEYLGLVPALAFDATRFERGMALLVEHLLQDPSEMTARPAHTIIVCRFSIHNPGTMASWARRLALVEGWLAASSETLQQLGLDALEHILWRGLKGRAHWSSDAEPGGGTAPASDAQALDWLNQAIAVLTKQALAPGARGARAKAVLADSIAPLIFDPVTRAIALAAMGRIASAGFWLQGWSLLQVARPRAVGDWPVGDVAVLDALQAQLAPTDLVAEVLTTTSSFPAACSSLVPGESYEERERRSDDAATAIGTRLAGEEGLRQSMWPDLLCSGGRVSALGRGLATANDPEVIWQELVAASREVEGARLQQGLLSGFLGQLNQLDPLLAVQLLEAALEDPVLRMVFPALQRAIGFDRDGIARLHRCLLNRRGSVKDFVVLGKALDVGAADDGDLQDLLRAIADREDGYTTALHILLQWDRDSATPAAARRAVYEKSAVMVLDRADFNKQDDSLDHLVAGVAACVLAGADGAQIGADLAHRLRSAAGNKPGRVGAHQQLLAILVELQPRALLDAMMGPDGPLEGAANVFQCEPDEGGAAVALDRDLVLDWCGTDLEPRSRYMLQISPLLEPEPASARAVLTPLTLALFERSVDPAGLLGVVENGFWRPKWEGSYSVQLEANADALDPLLELHDDRFRAVVRGLQSEMRAAAIELAQQDADKRLAGGRYE